MQAAIIVRLTTVLVCLLGAGGLVGCRSAQGTGDFDVAPGAYAQAFDATRDVLREYRFALDRVDSQQGIITTEAKTTHGLATPWDTEQTTLRQDADDLLNQQVRRARVTFRATRDADELEEDSGTALKANATNPLRARVEVTIYRIQRAGFRPASRSVTLSTAALDPTLAAQGLGQYFEAPMAQDDQLAARLARAIEARVAGMPAEPAGPDAVTSDSTQQIQPENPR